VRATAFFFLCLAVLAVLIWLLSLMSSVMSEDDPEDAANGTDKCRPTEESQHYTRRQHGVTAVTNAIHAYRRSRHSQERRRAKREKKTIVVLIATAIFAFIAAIAAIASAWIFEGQLTEMQRAGADARIFSQAQLRAYITVTGLEIERGDPNRNIGGMLESKFWMARPEIENSGSSLLVISDGRWGQPSPLFRLMQSQGLCHKLIKIKALLLLDIWNYRSPFSYES